jgi:hypothetical protein
MNMLTRQLKFWKVRYSPFLSLVNFHSAEVMNLYRWEVQLLKQGLFSIFLNKRSFWQLQKGSWSNVMVKSRSPLVIGFGWSEFHSCAQFCSWRDKSVSARTIRWVLSLISRSLHVDVVRYSSEYEAQSRPCVPEDLWRDRSLARFKTPVMFLCSKKS